LHFERLGELIASLNEHALRFRPPRGFARPRWEQAFEKRFANLRIAHKQKRLSRERLMFFEAARQRARRAARRLGRSRNVYGLIHADLGYANHLFHDGRAGAIDFEACGYGWFLHDLAEPLVFVQHVKHYPSFRDAILAGYRRVRPLPPDVAAHLDDFIDFSALTSIGYIAGEPTRKHDLAWMARYLCKVLRKPSNRRSPRSQ
jgi:Ser/Thr protein kinase RdoA (MazF antagonist)